MGLKKLTFDEALNTAKDDAFFNYYLTGKTNGIFNDLGGKCKATSANGQITFQDGFITVYGRRVYVESGTSISVPLDSTKKGYVIVKIDTVNNSVTLALKEGDASNYPTLTQTNLLEEDGIYEQPLCSYEKTTTSLDTGMHEVTLIRDMKSSYQLADNSIKNNLNIAIEDIEDTIARKQHGVSSYSLTWKKNSGALYTYDITSIMNKDHMIITAHIGNDFVLVPLRMLKSVTSFTFTYHYLNNSYTGTIEYASGTLIYELAQSSHPMNKSIICYY